IAETRGGGEIPATDAAARITRCTRAIWARPVCQQLLRYRVYKYPRALKFCKALRNGIRPRHTTHGGLCAVLALAFVIGEQEGLVLDDRTAERSTKLVVMKRVLRIAARVEEIA